MKIHCIITSAILVTALSHHGVADEGVFGPPVMVVNGQVETGGPGNEELLLGRILRWEESRQEWDRNGIVEHGGRSVFASRTQSRKVRVLHGKQFISSLNSLRFTTLSGERIEASKIKDLIRSRAFAFLEKGSRIHPDIANALHPETIVVTRFSYPEAPITIALPDEK